LAEWLPEQHFDAIINLAGEPIVDARWTVKRKRVLWDSRVTLTQHLVARIAAAQHKPRILLSGSAIGYYGDRGDTRLDETATPGSGYAARLCAAWEAAASEAEKLGVCVCLLRTGLVLSRDGGLLQRMYLPFKLAMGARLGDGQQWMSWIHIDDYVAIVVRLLHQAKVSAAYNLTAPQPVSNAEFTATLAGTLHRPAWLVAPAALLNLLLGERAGLLLHGQRVLPDKISIAGYQFRYASLGAALHNLFAPPQSNY
jgi:uncharacterized protein (TIGR01777 family)